MKLTKHAVCNYAVLRFLPYPETGEFVNLGIVVHCPDTGFFDAKLETRKSVRVTNFFPELDKACFRATRTAIFEELARVRSVIRRTGDREQGRRVFREVVRQRESVFRFGETRTILTADPATLAAKLYDQYVARHFAQVKQYHESVMAKRFFEALQNFRPERRFRREVIVGTTAYHVRIPICSEQTTVDGVPRRAIKPLDLNRPDPAEIIDHGNLWIGRVEGLKDVGHKPERFIFAVNHPRGGGKVLAAAKKIADKLHLAGAVVVKAQEQQKVLELAAD